MGEVGILNVGAGDTKLTFDNKNPADTIRAARIVKDMLRRGYALLVEVNDGKGGKHFQRARDFNEVTCEYIIADFDPIEAAAADQAEADNAESGTGEAGAPTAPAAEGSTTPARRRGRKVIERTIPAASTRSIAVARSAGG